MNLIFDILRSLVTSPSRHTMWNLLVRTTYVKYFKIRIFHLLVVTVSFWSTCLHAHGDGDTWAFVVIPMCLSQNPSYASTTVGHKFLHENSVETFLKTPIGVCFSKHKWASKPLCDEIMNLQDEEWGGIESLYKRHQAEIRGMKNAFDYFNDVLLTPMDQSAQLQCPSN